ncbi:hypothetical protein U1Q18_002503 [Sarracenia purpurea var. burkii]
MELQKETASDQNNDVDDEIYFLPGFFFHRTDEEALGLKDRSSDMELQKETASDQNNDVDDEIYFLPGFFFHRTDEEALGLKDRSSDMELQKETASDQNNDVDDEIKTTIYRLAGCFFHRTDEEELRLKPRLPRFQTIIDRYLGWRLRPPRSEKLAERWRQLVDQPVFFGAPRSSKPADQDLPPCPHCKSTQTKSCLAGNYYSPPFSCKSCHHCWTPDSTRSIYAMKYDQIWPDSNPLNHFPAMHSPNRSSSQSDRSRFVAGSSSLPLQEIRIEMGNLEFGENGGGARGAATDQISRTDNRSEEERWVKLAEMVLGISASAGYASSSIFPKAANAAAFVACLTAISLRRTGWLSARILAKFGAFACAAGTLAALGMDLPGEYKWVAGMAFLFPAIAVAFS